MRYPLTCLSTALAFCLPAQVQAQDVALAGILGGKALLVVNGSAPRGVAPGESHMGVQVVSVGREDAVVDSAGGRRSLRLGELAVPLRVEVVAVPQDAQDRAVLDGQPNARGGDEQPLFDELVDGREVDFGRDELTEIGPSATPAHESRIWAGTGTAQGATVRAAHLGWAPHLVDAASAQATPGARVAPAPAGGPGLAAPARLASGSGLGSATLGADLELQVPVDTKAGGYAGALTVSLFPED